MASMKIVETADLHVSNNASGKFDPATGLNTTNLEALRQLRNIVDLCNDEQADILLIAGDVWHDGRPLPQLVSLFNKEMMRLDQDGRGKFRTKVVVANGNHDQTNIVDGHDTPLDAYFRAMKWCHHVSSKTELVSVDGLSIASVPWHRVAGTSMISATEQQLVADIQSLMQQADEIGDPSLLYGHVMLDDVVFNPSRMSSEKGMSGAAPFATVNAALLESGPWALSRLGHVHRRQDITRTVGYIGSPYRVDFGEAGDPKGAGLITVDSDGEMSVEFREFRTRQLVALELSEGNGPLIAAEESFESGDILRYWMAHDQDGLNQRGRAIIKRLEAKGVQVEARRRPRPDVVRSNVVDLQIDSDPDDAMRKYLATIYQPDEVKRLMNTFADVMKEV